MPVRRPGPVWLAAAAVLFWTGSAHGQERPREARDREQREPARQDTVVGDTVYAPGPSLGYDAAPLSFVFLVGVPGSGDAQTQPMVAWHTDSTGTVVDSSSLTRTTRVRGALGWGISAILGLGPDWALRVGVAGASARLETGYGGDNELFVDSANALGTAGVDIGIFSLESALQYRIPSSKRLQPYVELGAAFSRWSADGALPAAVALDQATRFEVTAGVGGVVPLSRRLSAQLYASTRVLRTPAPALPAGDTAAATPTFTFATASTRASTFADNAREILSLLRLQVGLSFDLGRPEPAPAPPPVTAEPPDTTPPPGH